MFIYTHPRSEGEGGILILLLCVWRNKNFCRILSILQTNYIYI